MFFIFSKILAFITSPLIWTITLLIISWFTKKEKTKKIIFWTSIAVFYLFSNMFIATEFMRFLEYRYEKESYVPEKNNKFDYAIALGGMSWYNENIEKPQFQRSADRLFQTLWLLKQNKIEKIIFTGGSGSISYANHKEGVYLKKWLQQIGIQDTCLIFETESKNT